MRAADSCVGLSIYLCLGALSALVGARPGGGVSGGAGSGPAAARPDLDDDSLEAAINVVSQRRRAMALAQAQAQAREYDTEDALSYLDFPSSDVRLEGPGYQMLLSQGGGRARSGNGPYSKEDSEWDNDRSRSLEEALAEYINNVTPEELNEAKRSASAFREVSEQPDVLQRLGARVGDDPTSAAAGFLTSFRERTKPSGHEDRHRAPAVDRDDDDEREYLEEYFDALNDAVNTYLQNAIPLDLQKNYKDIKKRQYDNFDTGYDFFNSPLQGWSKRGRGHGKYAYGLSFYDDDGKRTLERVSSAPSGGGGRHVMRKRLWRDGSVDKHKATQRLMLKRASKVPHGHAIASGARLVRNKKDARKLSMLHEKTDPSVAKELSGIFMAPKETNHTKAKNKTEKAVELKVKLDTATTTVPPVKASPKPSEAKSKTKQKLGQLEEATEGEGEDEAKPVPIAMAKKSVDWSDYFGIDRRRKKSLGSVDDNWLLDQYLEAYAREREGQGKAERQDELEKEENYEMLMDSLREAADAIIGKAIKYTGAHEGIRNEEVIDKVRSQVMNQLALAYDLENIRRILEEHKEEYSQEQPQPTLFRGVSETKKKRVAVKKEKAIHPDASAIIGDENNSIGNTASPQLLHNNDDGACAEVTSRIILCRTVISSNHSALMTPCVIHSFCSTCSKCSDCADAPTERQCDVNFLELADNVCGESRPFCRYTARHVLPSMKTSYTKIRQNSDPVPGPGPGPGSCDLDGVATQIMQCTQNGTIL